MSPSTSWPWLALVMLLAGIGIPIQAALNGSLGGRLENAPAAAMFAALLAATAAIITASFYGLPRPSAWAQAPATFYFGGLFMAFYVIAITFIGPRFGLGNAIFFVLLGQIISAATIDHFGLFGVAQSRIDWVRIAGIVLMGLGVFLARKA